MSTSSSKTIKNAHGVPQKQWRKWNAAGREAFNRVYAHMSDNQSLYLHPDQKKSEPTHWKTTAWNAAWSAADAASGLEYPVRQ